TLDQVNDAAAEEHDPARWLGPLEDLRRQVLEDSFGQGAPVASAIVRRHPVRKLLGKELQLERQLALSREPRLDGPEVRVPVALLGLPPPLKQSLQVALEQLLEIVRAVEVALVRDPGEIEGHARLNPARRGRRRPPPGGRRAGPRSGASSSPSAGSLPSAFRC